MDLYFGFGPVIRIRKLKPKTGRRKVLGGRVNVETVTSLQWKHDKALDLLNRRRDMRLLGEDTPLLDREIRRLGYEFEDEPSAIDGRFSYWRKT